MIHAVQNIDENKTLYFDSRTPYEAMEKLLYYLSPSNGEASKAKINKTETNRFLYVVVKGKTYCTKM